MFAYICSHPSVKVMKNLIFTAILLSFTILGAEARDRETFIVLSWNVENLFDTEDDPLTDDDAFTPEGEKQWTQDRYEAKLQSLAKGLRSLPEKELPAIVALCEVENRRVLNDLAGRRELRKASYSIVHEEDNDPRGIECALLYNPDLFKYEEHSLIPVSDPTDPEYILRSILYVRGKAPDGRDLHIYVNHWKSRSGGERETRMKRMAAAIALRKHRDKLLGRDMDARVIIVGDFNDEPTNRSLLSGLSASGQRRNIELGDYYNLCYDAHNTEGAGTYAYRGQWNMLDQLILSHSLMNQGSGLSASWDGMRILREEWMLYQSEKYGKMLPSSTYGGPEYFGGVSDHLPVYVALTY